MILCGRREAGARKQQNKRSDPESYPSAFYLFYFSIGGKNNTDFRSTPLPKKSRT